MIEQRILFQLNKSSLFVVYGHTVGGGENKMIHKTPIREKPVKMSEWCSWNDSVAFGMGVLR